MSLAPADLLPLVAAFALGLAVGWFIWGGARRRAAPGAQNPIAAQIAVLETELKAAQALLAEETMEPDPAAGIDAIDARIKQANGRLKLIQRALKKSGER